MKITVDIPSNQNEVWGTLLHALESNSFPQSILIEGNPGVGKKVLALQLGIILMCEDTETKPCGTCFSCQCAKKEEGPNFMWLPPVTKKNSGEDFNNAQHRKDAIHRVVPLIIQNPYDISAITAKSYIAVNMVRDIKGSLAYKDKGNRVIFIPEADKMNKNAANALLKVLEEVPDKCYFILTTSNKSALLPTILSRCLQVSIPEMGQDEMEQILADYDYTTENKELLCNLSEGAPGQAMSLINMEFKKVRDEAFTFLKSSILQKYPQMMKQIEGLKYDEEKSIAHCDFLYILLHDLFLVQNEAFLGKVRNVDIIDQLKELSNTIGDSEVIQKAMRTVVEYRRRLFSNAKPAIALGALGLDLV